ncbi:ATP-binding domain-containing protein, partial [bacterium]|nr:ATP-binding domain-containing protein [bacterium]
GADINNILNYERDFSDSTLIKLEQNYRSTKTILSASNAIIVRNKSRKDKELWTENGDGEKISYVSSMTGKDEARFVADEIVRLRGQGYSYRNIAIFYRTNAQSRAFEDVFTGINIPYVIYGGLRFYERMEVKDILAYLKFLTSPHDSVSLKRIINKPVRGIGNTTISKLESVASQYNISLYSAIEESAKQRIFNFGTIKKLESFVKLVCELRNLLGTETLPSIIKAVIDKSGYVSNLKLQNSHEAQDRIDNLNELIASGEEFAKGLGEEKDQLRTFLDQVSLVSGIDGFDPSLGQIPMMTLHLAKGLEFPIVFMVGMEEGLFPHSRSMDNEDELEEERRLCYVGMTRAMEKLYMCNAWRRAVYGSEQCNLPSRFIDDIPSEYIVRKNMMPKVKPLFRPEIGKSASVDFDFDQRSDCEKHGEYFIGRKVKHQKFGVGTIKRHEESHEGPKVTVYFQSGNVKKLLVKYANLELL